MKHTKFYKIDEELHNKIINAAYGDAGIFDKIKIYFLAKKYPEVKFLFDEYRATSKAVHSIEKEFMPDELLEKVKIKAGSKEPQKNSFFFDFYSFVFARPAVSAFAAAVLIIIIITSAFIKEPGFESQYSKEEVALANKQTKQALAIIGKVFSNTEKTLKNDILAKRVGQPINEGLNMVNNLFNEENKNEKLN